MPWLVANGKRGRAEEIIKKAAKFNNVDIPAHIFGEESRDLRANINPALLDAEDGDDKQNGGVGASTPPEQKSNENALTIFRHSKLRMYTLVMLCLW